MGAGLSKRLSQAIFLKIDTVDATGRLLFNMLGVIAQFETEIPSERQMDGIRNAKGGVHLGKRKDLTEQECLELRQRRKEGILVKTLMKEYSLSKASVYRYFNGVKVESSSY